MGRKKSSVKRIKNKSKKTSKTISPDKYVDISHKYTKPKQKKGHPAAVISVIFLLLAASAAAVFFYGDQIKTSVESIIYPSQEPTVESIVSEDEDLPYTEQSSKILKVSQIGKIIKSGKLKNGEDITYKVYDNGILSLSGKGEIKTAMSDMFSLSKITKILVGRGITGIGDNAFEGCLSVSAVSLSDTITYIGDRAFCRCGSLSGITIPKNVKTIGTSAFSRCAYLKRIDLPEGLVSIGDSAFSYCRELKTFVIPKTVTSIGKWAFTQCTKLTFIEIPPSVVSIGEYAFHTCMNLKTIYIRGQTNTIPEGWNDLWSSECSASIVWKISVQP